jgi:F-type H+-transporting ATPase subunit b
MNNLLILAAEEGGNPGAVILPETAELVYGFIAFMIVFFVLRAVAFPRINQLLEDRAAAIQGKMEEADKALAEAETVKANYAASVDEARGEANRIIDEAKSTAESLRRDIIAKAEAEAQSIVARAQNEVATERDRVLQELRAEVGSLSVALASKIVEKELDPAAHQGLVDEYIQSLSRSN